MQKVSASRVEPVEYVKPRLVPQRGGVLPSVPLACAHQMNFTWEYYRVTIYLKTFCVTIDSSRILSITKTSDCIAAHFDIYGYPLQATQMTLFPLLQFALYHHTYRK